MREVTVTLSAPEHEPDEAVRTVADYGRYPDLTDSVIDVRPTDLGAGRHLCSWQVRFRRGVLHWTEESTVDLPRHRIDFVLVEGDLDHFRGHWQVEPAERGSTIRFWCEFDIGIPTLSDLIEPVAADALRDNVIAVCRGLFGPLRPEAAAEV